MQSTISSGNYGNAVKKLPAVWRSRIVLGLIPLLIIAFVGAGLYWLQWASATGIKLGYPVPHVHIAPLSSTTLLLHAQTQFKASSAGRDLTYSWSIDGQRSQQGQQMIYAFNDNGPHTVSVTVTDPVGHQSADMLTIQVLPPPPTASFLATQRSSWFGYEEDFDASGSAADPSTTIQTYHWDFGDGNTSDGYSASTYHYYDKPGTYTVTLVVIDALNQSSQSYTQTVTVAASNS